MNKITITCLITSLFICSCQTPKTAQLYTDIKVDKSRKIVTPHKQRQENREAKLERKITHSANFLMSLPLKFLLTALESNDNDDCDGFNYRSNRQYQERSISTKEIKQKAKNA